MGAGGGVGAAGLAGRCCGAFPPRGSRCWGFASSDSDYDIRFIYVRQLKDYLSIDPVRDVIEEPVDELWDLNGWDLGKALRLMKKKQLFTDRMASISYRLLRGPWISKVDARLSKESLLQ